MKTGVFFVLSGVLILTFNNCGRLSPVHYEGLTNSSSLIDGTDTSTLPNTEEMQPSTPPDDTIWQNEPQGSQRKVDCDFTTSNCMGQVAGGTFIDVGAKYYNSPTPVKSDPLAPLSPGSIVDAFLPFVGICMNNDGKSFIQCANGGATLTWYNNMPSREIYFGAYFKINAEYGTSLAGASKDFFLRTAENRFEAPATNGVFLIRGYGDIREMVFAHNTNGLDNSHACQEGGATCFSNVGPGKIMRGKWVKFEACVRASTSLTSRDAVVRWWVDGQPAGSYNNLNYGALVANEWLWNQTWDGYGNGQGFSTDAHQYLDHVVVSIPPDGGCAKRK